MNIFPTSKGKTVFTHQCLLGKLLPKAQEQGGKKKVGNPRCSTRPESLVITKWMGFPTLSSYRLNFGSSKANKETLLQEEPVSSKRWQYLGKKTEEGGGKVYFWGDKLCPYML